MGNNFKAGDIVVCIEDNLYLDIGQKYLITYRGKVYSNVTDLNGKIIGEEFERGAWRNDRFAKANVNSNIVI